MEYKSFGTIEFKSDSESSMWFKAYALGFNNVDSVGDIILPGACDAWMKSEMADRVALCYQHDFKKVIGKITDKGVDENGMWIEGEVLPTTEGKDVMVLMRNGAIKEFSIGYSVDEWHNGKSEEGYDVRYLDAITIYEVSPVTIAANPKATLQGVKSDERIEQNIESEIEVKQVKQVEMEEKNLEMLEMLEKANQAIDNLDKSINDIKAENEELKSKLNEKKATFESKLWDALEAHKGDIERFVKGDNKTYGSMSFKITSVEGTGLGAPKDINVYSSPFLKNVFYDTFRKVQRSGTNVEWIDGSANDNIGYVGEFAAPAAGQYTATAKVLPFAKIATLLEVSQEVTDWQNAVYQWVKTEGVGQLLKEANSLILTGDGDLSVAAKKNHAYGLITSGSTAFTATGAKFVNANVADVILDAISQIAAKGFMADTVFVPFALEAQIRGLKDANGNYLYNQLTGMLGQVKVLPSADLTATQLVVCDSSAVEIVEKGEYEMEIERVAGKDGWNCWLRKAFQVKVPTANKGGVVYVANVTTAITAVTQA